MGAKGSGGRNRKSAAQKAAEGNRGRRPLDLRPPKALPGEPPMPTWLTAAARALWPEVCAIIQANGVLYATDGMAVAALCSSLAMFRQAEEELVGKHLTWDAVDKMGNIAVRSHPAVRVRALALREMRASWQSFGLDPSSRAGLDACKKGSDEPMSAIDKILRSKKKSDDDDDVVM
jgi:P27 family predicted phage terminase small subunit